MFAGHVGVGLALARVERRVPAAVFVAAALLPDVLLWGFVLAGWERVSIPVDYAQTHQVAFVFPYTHGLLAAVAWSIAAGAVTFVLGARLKKRLLAAVLVAAAVLSHWVLDVLVHVPEMPLAGEDSLKVGLGMWNNPAMAIGVESAITVAGLAVYLFGALLTRGKKIALAAVVMLVLIATIAGMTVAPPPPSGKAMAGGSLVTLAVVVGLVCWLGRRKGEGNPSG